MQHPSPFAMTSAQPARSVSANCGPPALARPSVPLAPSPSPPSTALPPPPSPSITTPSKTPQSTSLPPSGQPTASFARPRPSQPAPAPPSTPPPMAATYWSRLSTLLREAAALATSLVPLPELTADKAAKGASGIVAVDLQGLRFEALQKVVLREAAKDENWKQANDAGGSGAFAAYGVAGTSAHWVALRLSQTCSTDGWKAPSPGLELEVSDTFASPDPVVEAVRVRVWESEPAFLPVALSERLVGFRRRLRRYRGRVELCVKILSSLEGRGRKLAAGALEKAKFALEKADAVHAKEEQRIKEREDKEKKAAENARLKLERKLENTLRVKEQKVKKSIDRKRRQEASAQAMFMKKFVKQKGAPSAKAKQIECIILDEAIAERTDDHALQQGADSDVRERARAVPANSDKDAMSSSWWLQSEMYAPKFAELDSRLKESNYSANGIQTSPDGVFRQHMYSCAERRKAAEARIHKVLRDYRHQRKTHLDDRMPRFTQRRSDVRGRGVTGPVKLLQFAEDHRPAFFGTDIRQSKTVGPRRPLSKDTELDYSYDSGEEWEEEEDAEDLLDIEADKERADEDDELRKLYGSDEEEDDDFLDDNEADDDDDDDTSSNDEADNEREDSGKLGHGSIPVSADGTPSSPKAIGNSTNAIVDSTVTPPGSGTKRARSPKKDGSGDRSKLKRRRRNKFKQSVVIQGVSWPKPGEESPLDCYAVTALDGAPRILMFNPYITHVADFLQETSPPKPTPIRIPRTSLDAAAKHELAVVLVTGTSKTSRDNIVFEFCERRRRQGLPVPPKIEVVRAIRVIATNEKRKGDGRAAWYLKDQLLAAKIRDMNLTTSNPRVLAPAAATQKTAAIPIQVTPSAPFQMVPATPVRKIPVTPNNKMSSIPVQAMPMALTTSNPRVLAPAAATQKTAAIPIQVTPSAPFQMVPATPVRKIPVTPNNKMSSIPVQAMPMAPTQSMGAAPIRNMSDVVDATSPTTAE